MRTSYLTVQNAGTTRVDSFVVSWPGGSQDFGSIDAGATIKASFVVSTDGGVTFQERRGTATAEGTLHGYISSMDGDDFSVVTSEASVLVNGSLADPIEPED
jgi:hypothetical protein